MAQRNSMKAKAGKTLATTLVGIIFLWVLIPTGLYFLGYKLIGPEIGKVPALNTQAKKVENLIANEAEKARPKKQEPDPNDDQAASTDPSKAPEIDIEVVPRTGHGRTLRTTSDSDQSRPKKKKKKSKPAVRTSQPRDEASGDAAMPGGDGPSDPAGGGQ